MVLVKVSEGPLNVAPLAPLVAVYSSMFGLSLSVIGRLPNGLYARRRTMGDCVDPHTHSLTLSSSPVPLPISVRFQNSFLIHTHSFTLSHDSSRLLGTTTEKGANHFPRPQESRENIIFSGKNCLPCESIFGVNYPLLLSSFPYNLLPPSSSSHSFLLPHTL